MDDLTQLRIGIAVVGVVLLFVTIAAAIIIIWICFKLKQHEQDINKLLDPELCHVSPRKTKFFYCRQETISNLGMENGEIKTKALEPSAVSTGCGEWGEKVNIMIHKETATVYGRDPLLDQVMMTAQNYYKEFKNVDEDVPVESVSLQSECGNAMSRSSKLFTSDWRLGAPTSFLLNGDASNFGDILTQNQGLFMHMSIGPAGGRLAISGVSLDIPEGALDQERLISLGILWDDKLKPKLSKKQTMLSPIVLCQPSGLKFKAPVTLSFPHAAKNILLNWHPMLIKREGNLDTESSWEDITLNDVAERFVDEHKIRLKLRHFTLYTAVGESLPGKVAAKFVHLVTFTNKLEKAAIFKPRVYCLNKYKDIKGVCEMAGHLSPTAEMADTTELLVHDNEHDVAVELAKLSDGWKLAGEKIETLSFETVWHDFHPHCTFLLKQTTSNVSEIICEFLAYQHGAENRTAKMKVAEILPVCSSPLSTAYEDPVEDLIRELIILLDPDDTCSDAGDWRALAEKMGCGLTRIRWLGTQTSKTRLLIEKWMEDKRSFTELRDVLFRINRPDAAHEVERRLNHLEPNRRNQRHTDFVQRAENKGDIGHRSENCALGNKDGNRGSGKRDRKCVSEQFARRESGISGGICACRNSDRNNDSGKTGLNHALGITVSGDLQNGNGLNDLGKKDNSRKRENGCTLENRFETGKSENADIRKAVENTDDVSYCKHSDDSNMSVI